MNSGTIFLLLPLPLPLPFLFPFPFPGVKKKKKGKEKDEEEESFSLVASYSCYNFHSKKSAVIPFCFFDVSSCDI